MAALERLSELPTIGNRASTEEREEAMTKIECRCGAVRANPSWVSFMA
jgi:hypothetical protein